MERRLGQSPLSSPEFAFADQQTLPEQSLGHPLRQLALVKFTLLDDEHLLDIVRMAQQDAALEGDGQPHNIAVLARGAAHRAERVTPNLERHSGKRPPLRARRDSTSICRDTLPRLVPGYMKRP